MNVVLSIFIHQRNFLIFSIFLALISLPLASHQNEDFFEKTRNKSSLQPTGNHSSKKTFKLIFPNNKVKKRNTGGAGKNGNNSTTLNISEIVNVLQLANIAEELSSGQLHVKQAAALKARQKLAQLSYQWALFAQKLTQWKSNEVMDLTKKAQAAQILSLNFASIATRLQSAVMAAQDVYNSAFDRYKKLASLAEAAQSHSTATSKALMLLQYTQSVREKWASDEQARAFRLSQHLQNILYDLKRATEFAEEAHEHALSTKQYIHFHY